MDEGLAEEGGEVRGVLVVEAGHKAAHHIHSLLPTICLVELVLLGELSQKVDNSRSMLLFELNTSFLLSSNRIPFYL